MSGSDDIKIVLTDDAAAGKTPPPPKWWHTKRGQALAGVGLLCLVIPAIVAPVVVTSQKKAEQQRLTNTGSRSGSSINGDPDADDFTASIDRAYNTYYGPAFNATSNTTLKVPTRTLNRPGKIIVEEEKRSPFVTINDGQVSLLGV